MRRPRTTIHYTHAPSRTLPVVFPLHPLPPIVVVVVIIFSSCDLNQTLFKLVPRTNNNNNNNNKKKTCFVSSTAEQWQPNSSISHRIASYRNTSIPSGPVSLCTRIPKMRRRQLRDAFTNANVAVAGLRVCLIGSPLLFLSLSLLVLSVGRFR